MSDRKPKVGEVWTNYKGEPWECLKVLPNDKYVWFAFGRDAVKTDAENLTPPTTPPPAWLDDDCWVHFESCSDDHLILLSSDLFDGDYNPSASIAKVRVDPSTFEWLDGR